MPHYRNISPTYEFKTLEIWRKLVLRDSVVWDVGANIGIYSIVSGKLVGPKGEVIGFEPTPFTQRVAARHIELNDLASHCRIEPCAVSDTDGATLEFQVQDKNGSDPVNPTNRLGSNPTARCVKVPVVSLDGLVQRASRKPSFVKIDIEGAEVFALRGATRTLQDVRPIFQIEVHPMFLPEFGCDSEEIASIFKQNRYVSFDIHGNPSPPTQYAEYFLIPEELSPEICRRLGWPQLTKNALETSS